MTGEFAATAQVGHAIGRHRCAATGVPLGLASAPGSAALLSYGMSPACSGWNAGRIQPTALPIPHPLLPAPGAGNPPVHVGSSVVYVQLYVQLRRFLGMSHPSPPNLQPGEGHPDVHGHVCGGHSGRPGAALPAGKAAAWLGPINCDQSLHWRMPWPAVTESRCVLLQAPVRWSSGA